MKKLKVKKLGKLKSAPTTGANASRRWADSYVNYLRSECHLAENTVMAYRRDLNRFLDWLGSRSIPRLTVSQLSDFVAKLGELSLIHI